jgi:hypothetical protein
MPVHGKYGDGTATGQEVNEKFLFSIPMVTSSCWLKISVRDLSDAIRFSQYGKITKDTKTEKISGKAAKAHRFKAKSDETLGTEALAGPKGGNRDSPLPLLAPVQNRSEPLRLCGFP